MVSHKFCGGHSRPRDFMSQNRNTPSSVTEFAKTSNTAPGAQLSEPQTALDPSKTSRSFSFSDAEGTRPIAAPARPKPTKIPSSNDVRLSLLPRPTAGHRPPPNSRTEIQQTIKSEKQIPVHDQPRNMLRRKAATIGQSSEHSDLITGSERPEKLRVVIPNTSRPGHFTDVTPRMPWGQPERARNDSSSSIPQGQTANRDTEPPTIEGPQELASLRTVVNTQNLPPPTPVFPTASSPSTQYSRSPAIWSRGSTPSSVSSYSPGIVYPSKFGQRLRQASPSETRLPVYSPVLQQSGAQGDLADHASTRSPSLPKGTGSSLSVGNTKQEEPSRLSDSTKSLVLSKSGLPRRTSINSNLPGKAKVDTKVNRGSKEDAQKPLGSSSSTANKSKNPGPTPSRPTRDGTDELELEPSPVIRSELPPKTVSSHKQRESTENKIPAVKKPTSSPRQSPVAPTNSHHSRRSSRTPSSTTSPAMPQKPPRISTKEQQGKKDTKGPTTTPTSATKRFGIFSRKNKSETDAPISEQSRLPRKGPAAGTGHEGYGKYAHGGRKTSVSSNNDARARSMSTTSGSKSIFGSKRSAKNRQEPEIDDFLLNRLEPVVINGGGIDETTLVRTPSEQSASGYSAISASNVAQQDKEPRSTGYSTESLGSSSSTSQPGASSVERLFHCPAVSSSITSSSSQPRPDIPKGQKQKQSKKGKRLRSFFQRSHSKQRKDSTAEAPTTSVPQLQAKITPVAASRPVAHYALLDTDPDSLEDIIHDIEDSPLSEYEQENHPPVEVPAALNVQKSRQSILLPSLPTLQPEYCSGEQSPPKVYMNKSPRSSGPGPEENPKSKRPSRLASIGRIPQVISRRDRQHKPASQSFSRPFSQTESPSLPAPVAEEPNDFQTPAPGFATEKGRSTGKPTGLGFDLTQPFGDGSERSAMDFVAGPYSRNEFLRFSPDKNSPHSSSGSDGLAAITASIRNPDTELSDDEVWKEYDDLIDHVLSPVTPETMEPHYVPSDAKEKLGQAELASKMLQAELDAYRDLTALPTLAEHPSPSSRHSDQSVRLRRSRIASALRSSFAPSSQPLYNDLKAERSESQDNQDGSGRLTSPSIQRVEEQPSFLLSPLNPSQSFEACRQRNTILFDIAERDREGPTAQTNIRSGSLMTSRWLSFGRVLFSPAHNHVKSGEQERVLVIDGLGNDDWSFYCALTYTNTDVYNLHVGPSPAASSHPAAWQPPTNYHTVYHPHLEDRFPFPKGFFAATVLRFPAASSEYVQNNIASECKRVLRPGGYMEMSILDLDMVNMGIRTRKAVRGLKERTYLADSNISLKPASDNIQRLLGRHGFDNLHRCMVRIPVAGVITRSSASSSSTSSSSAHPSMSIPAATRSAPSFGQDFEPTATTIKTNHHRNKHGKSPSNDTDLSLGDLLSDPAPSPSNDESIRKIVAKVGRWWYTRCYEIPVLPGGDVDLRIWSDKKVLRECQKRGTGFRLLIAHAQKPSEVNRRTASV